MITAKEIAIRLNISEAAVSMALNNKSGVSTQLKAEIISYAKANGYDFSRIVSKQCGNGNIAFVYYRRHGAIVDDQTFFYKVIEGIRNTCRDNGYNFVHYSVNNEDEISGLISALRASAVQGILILGTEILKSELKQFLSVKEPIVVLDTYFHDIPFDFVLINNIQGAFLATEHLIKARKAQPSYLSSSYPIQNFAERADGFYKAIRSNGLSAGNSVRYYLSPTINGAYADMKEILKRDKPKDCYFADNDFIAIGAMRALKEANVKIPKQVSIIGFDDIEQCTSAEPPLTTVSVPKEFMGQVAINRLIQKIKSACHNSLKMEISTTLIERETVR